MADGDLNTSASVVVDSKTAFDGFSLRATAQSGVTFPAGSYAGFHWRDAVGSKCVAMRTYLDGAIQEDSFANVCADGGGAYGGDGVRTSKTFDAVEILLGGSGFLKIDEICANLS